MEGGRKKVAVETVQSALFIVEEVPVRADLDDTVCLTADGLRKTASQPVQRTAAEVAAAAKVKSPRLPGVPGTAQGQG